MMTAHDMPPDSRTERYLHVVRRGLPEEQGADVAAELRATIADRIESLRSERPSLSTEEAEYRALSELGDPAAMAASYAGRRLHLIGPELYSSYIRLLRTVLGIVLPTVTIALAVLDAIEGESVGAVIGHAVWVAFTVGVQICFWITLVYALLERGVFADRDAGTSGVGHGPGGGPGRALATQPWGERDLSASWTPDRLPRIVVRRIPLSDVLPNVVLLALLFAAIIWQQFHSPFRIDADPVPLLDPGLWSGWLPVILALLVAEAAFELVKYRVGAWSRRLATWNVALGALFALPVVWLAMAGRLLNPPYVAELQQRWSGFDPDTAHTVVAVVALAIWTWDSVEGWRKAVAETR